jgi:hypothetical protein
MIIFLVQEGALLTNSLDYPTRETQIIAQMRDFSLTQANLALLDQQLPACIGQLSAAAAYTGVLSLLLVDSQLGRDDRMLMHKLVDSLVVATLSISTIAHSN